MLLIELYKVAFVHTMGFNVALHKIQWICWKQGTIKNKPLCFNEKERKFNKLKVDIIFYNENATYLYLSISSQRNEEFFKCTINANVSQNNHFYN